MDESDQGSVTELTVVSEKDESKLDADQSTGKIHRECE